MSRIIIGLYLLFGVQASCYAATYYVSAQGSDAAVGSVSQPWKTLNKAAQIMMPGDIARVGPGYYDENVQTVRGGGGESSRIQFVADTSNSGQLKPTVRAFTISHPFITIDGFDITYRIPRASTTTVLTGYGEIVVNPNGSNCRITNNTIRDGVNLIGSDFEFRSADASIYTPSGNFLERGFAKGMSIYLGASSKNYYLNHGTVKTIKSISTDGHTLFLNEPLVAEYSNPWFAIIYAGSGNSGVAGLNMLLGSGTDAPTYCVVSRNKFRNLFGTNVISHGVGHVIEDNTFEDMQSYDAVRLFGTDEIFRRNIVRNSPNFIFYSADELGKIPHPEGGNFYDHMVAFLYTYGAIEERKNIIIENNYFENCYNQMGMFEESPKADGLIIRNNLFVGFPLHMSVSVANTHFQNNTFYKAAYEGSTTAAFGPRFSTSGPMLGLKILNNVFFDGGPKLYAGLENSGWYGVTGNTSYVADYNFVAGPETLGFSGRQGFEGKEPNGINGGDPLFLNHYDPDGADNIPLTGDDGFRPLPNSPLCPSSSNGGVLRGAYSCLTCAGGMPFAHFGLKDHNAWFDIRDPAWLSIAPEDRHRPWRLYTDPDTIGYVPVTVTFDAKQSVSCITNGSTSASGIDSYQWDFGDGSPRATGAEVSHVYTGTGEFEVLLTVTNSLNKKATYKNTYRVLGSKPRLALSLPFDGGLLDSSQRAHVVTVTGSVGFSNSGKWGQAGVFDGTDTLKVSHRDDLDGLKEITISGWFKKRAPLSLGQLIGKSGVFNLALTSTGQFNVYLNNATSTVSSNSIIPNLSTDSNVWHHYAVTYDGQSIRIYFDGAMLPSATKSMTGYVNRRRDATLDIGAGFDGSFDDIRIYDKALTASEISQLNSSSSDLTFGNVSLPRAPANVRVQ